jgi:hypothetical protein
MLHGLIVSVLSRFSVCWRSIYDENVRVNLRKIPKHINFDAAFLAAIPKDTEPVAKDLIRKRRTYRKYMAATADCINQTFVGGSLWATPTGNINQAEAVLDVFINSTS